MQQEGNTTTIFPKGVIACGPAKANVTLSSNFLCDNMDLLGKLWANNFVVVLRLPCVILCLPWVVLSEGDIRI